MKVKVLEIALVSVLLIIASLPAKAGIKFTVWATYYVPVSQPDVREVSLPDVFIKWVHLSQGSFDSEKWYPGPDSDRKHTEGDHTWNWNTLEMPPEEKPIPPDIDFFNSQEAIKSFYKSKKFEVRIKWRDKTVAAPVNISWDSLGPWNYQDNYWEDPKSSDSAQKRRLHASLERGTPAAEAAKDEGYLGGKDEADRIVLSNAGIDLSKALADEIGFTGHSQVEVEFLWVEEEPPPPPFADWPFIQYDIANTGNNPEALPIKKPKLDESFLVEEGVYGYSQPVVEGKMVYLAALNGNVYATNPSDKYCLWIFNSGAQEIKVTPALVGNKLYALDSNNILWVLNKKTGQVLGNCDIGLDYYWQTSPQAWKNYILFTIGPYVVRVRDDIPNPSVQAFDTRKVVKAKSEEGYDFLATGAIKDGVFYCFNAACQILAWDIESPDFDLLWYWLDFPIPKEIGNLTYLGNPKAIVLADKIAILKNNWRYDFSNPYIQPGETGCIYGVDIKKHDKILWAKEIGLGSAPPVFKDGALYPAGIFGTPEKLETTIYCFDPRTGDLLTPNAIRTNDDVELSIGGEVLYLSCWNFQKVIGVIFDPFEVLWQKDVPGYPFSAVVPAQDKAYVSLLASQTKTQSKSLAMLRPNPRQKQVSALAAENIVITSLSEEPLPPVYQKGDVSQDGNITAHDAELIMQHVVGQIKLTPEQLELADVSNNGQVSALDASRVMQMMTGVKKGVKK